MLKLSIAPPKSGECTYDGRFGNFCHRPGIPEQGGLCYWHSKITKTRQKFLEEYESRGSFEGVIVAGLDLSNLNLQGIHLRGFTAYRCSFDHSDLSKAWMDMAVFEGCNFIGANLRQIRAVFARLTKCIFYKANMEEANLLSANLANSCFDEVNLKNAKIGLAPMIVVPGLGNPDQYYTCIKGASFKNADIGGIHLNSIYNKAANLQESLQKVWLSEIRPKMDRALAARTNKEKKETLEKLVQELVARINGLKVYACNRRRMTDEIDIVVKNQSPLLITAGLGGPIFVECKNQLKPIGSGVVSKFAGKVPQAGIGLLVTTGKLTKDAQREMRIQMLLHAARGLRLVFWDRKDLQRIANGDDKPEDRLIERYYYILSI
jgi:uncharacterized protein YjbI with pentapeptide repeats